MHSINQKLELSFWIKSGAMKCYSPRKRKQKELCLPAWQFPRKLTMWIKKSSLKTEISNPASCQKSWPKFTWLIEAVQVLTNTRLGVLSSRTRTWQRELSHGEATHELTMNQRPCYWQTQSKAQGMRGISHPESPWDPEMVTNYMAWCTYIGTTGIGMAFSCNLFKTGK